MSAWHGGNSQRGAIGLMAVTTLMLALVFLMLALDSGRLYLTKRNAQRVADMAALEVILRSGQCNTQADQQARESAQLRNGFDLSVDGRDFTVTCGQTGVEGLLRTFVAQSQGPAVKVVVSETVPASLVLGGLFGQQVVISAEAVALGGASIGRLAIRNQLLSINSDRSLLLNRVVGGLLGGNLNVGLAGWQGLAGANVNLLSFLDELKVELGLGAGTYEQVLNTEVGVGRLVEVAAAALRRSGNAADVTTNALAALVSIGAIVPPDAIRVRLADILTVRQGVQEAALDVGLNALQLIEAMAQLANSKNAVELEVPINLPGLAGVNVHVKVIEPTQLSAIGDLARAKANPLGLESRIFVRTAQVRTLIRIDLSPTIGPLITALEAVTDTLAPVMSFLNEVLKLNLIKAIGNFLGGLACSTPGVACPTVDTMELKLPTGKLDLSLDVGGAQAYVSDYSCAGNGSPSMSVRGQSSVAHVRLGNMGNTLAEAKQAVFSSSVVPSVEPLNVLMLGERTLRPNNCLLSGCWNFVWKKGATWTEVKEESDYRVLAGIGLKVDSPVLGANQINGPVTITQVPLLTQPLKYADLGVSAGNQLIASLSSTLGGITLQAYKMQTPNLLGGILSATVGLVNALIKPLQDVIRGLLSPLLDPILAFLLNTLGIDLSGTEVGVSMQCGGGARLAM